MTHLDCSIQDKGKTDPKGNSPHNLQEEDGVGTCRGFHRSPQSPRQVESKLFLLPVANHSHKATKDSQVEMNQIKQCSLSCSSFPVQGQVVVPSMRQRQDWGRRFHLCPPHCAKAPPFSRGHSQALMPLYCCRSWGGGLPPALNHWVVRS